MKFEYGRGSFETTVKDDAGKYAVWNEQFVLHGINHEVEANKGFKLEAYEKDIASSDFLGRIKEISWKDAFHLIAAELNSLGSPNEAIF